MVTGYEKRDLFFNASGARFFNFLRSFRAERRRSG